MTDGYAIETHGLRKTYGSHHAVNGLDLAVARGEVFALLGPNGAGKTTTVEMLEGYRKRDGGEVRVLGEDPQRRTLAWRARIGIVLQSTGEFEELSVEEVVRHFAAYYSDPDEPARVIERVGLQDKRKARAKVLSGGQRRRLDVALGIIGRPELLFLDEPTTGFDPQARREFWELIRDLAAGGTTILLTTHYLDEAETLADRVGVIAGGRLIEVATPASLGGRGSAAAKVRWTGPHGPEVRDTDTPATFVAKLVDEFGGEVPDLVVSRPSLEDVYLSMIKPTEDQ
ncbi:ABC transporter ATP-binding protein [Dactylosporangium sp. CA-092794]|uniref:ABC transporter ATP-binding protein n=1 Tax=Dactylosporangium sp. CA-092794 TaxID=3239929 RepID=UPI003D8E62CB